MSESDDCLFCKIIAGQIPSSKVYEDEILHSPCQKYSIINAKKIRLCVLCGMENL